MKTINHECYVSLEVAKLLKEVGFDWKVRYMYRNNNPTLCICTEAPYRNMPKPNKCPMYWQYAAPALDVAQRWLREVKGYYIFVTDDSQCVEPNLIWVITRPSYLAGMCRGSAYEDYLEAGIKKALEIILEKGK